VTADRGATTAEAAVLAAPARSPFRKRFTGTRLAPDALDRQSRITSLALQTLGPDAAIVFLNEHVAALDGRPLDLAIASGAGYEAVKSELATRARHPDTASTPPLAHP
jgi:hypothetical protein